MAAPVRRCREATAAAKPGAKRERDSRSRNSGQTGSDRHPLDFAELTTPLPNKTYGLIVPGPYVRSCASSKLRAKYRVDITGIAEVDLEEIWILIAADSVENATRLVTELEAKIGTLEQMPNRCPAIPSNALLGTEYRHLIIGDHRVTFRVEGPTVYVLRIIHGNRLLDISVFRE